jgi:PIN domain nuclease of toxin-antitoxin system
MTPLLDTHALVWLALEPKRLSKKARHAMDRASARGGMAIASISLWEVALLVSRRRISLNSTVANWTTELLTKSGLAVLDLTPSIAELATSFGPDYSKDPADQIIGATARSHGLPLITADSKLQASPLLNCIW